MYTELCYTEDAKPYITQLLIYPYLTYGIEVWGAANKNKCFKNKLEVAQKPAIRCVSFVGFRDSARPYVKTVTPLRPYVS